MVEGFEQPPQEGKGADYMRKELEQFPFIKDPIEQWTDGEKDSFLKWCSQFNNFYYTLEGVLSENSPLLAEGEEGIYKDIKTAIERNVSDLAYLREVLGRKEEFYQMMIRDAQKLLADKGLLEEYKNTSARFYLMILPAALELIDSGHTLEDLAR